MQRVVAGMAILVGVAFVAPVQGQALDQVPSNATGVFEVKDLQGLSTKIAKLAKTLGVDQMDPKFADPLASLMTGMGIKQGLNKNGDMAIAFFKPKKAEGAAPAADDAKSQEPPLVVVLPVDDYKAFLGNFTDVKDVGNDISEVVVPANQEKLFVTHRGKYIVSTMTKALLSNPGGFKLQGSALKEVAAKDALIYIDVKSLRPDLKDGYAKGRAEIKKALDDPNNPVGVKVPPFVFALYDKVAAELINGTKSVSISFNLNDVGLGTAFMGDFESDSYLGKLVAQAKNSDKSLLAGLPDRPYLMYGDATLTPEVAQSLFNEMATILKQSPGDMKKDDLDKYIEAARKSLAGMRSVSFGMVAPQAGENYFQIVELVQGDAKQMVAMTKEAMPFMNSMMNSTPKTKAEMKFGDQTTVDGVQLTPYTMTFKFDEKDPMAAQEQQYMTMLYGPNGLMGNMGAVNDHTFISTMAVSPKLLAEAIAAAKSNADPLGQSDGLKVVAGQLPKLRGAEFYIALDNIANTAVAVMKQQGLPVQFKLPPNLPPIGFSLANDGSTARVDAFIPTRLVESMTAAVMQAMMQNNGNAGKGVE
jgi:hypothetical protein